MTPAEEFVVDVDGARLVGDLFGATVPRRGLALIRTPYDARRHHDLASALAGQGFDCLVQDVRGRHRSTGRWTPYDVEGRDGVATLAGLRDAGLSGPAVLYGASYAAHAALETARLAGPEQVSAVVALVPALGLHETAFDRAGTPQHRHRLGWWAQHGFAATDRPPLSEARLDAATAIAERHGPEAAAEALGWHGPELTAWRRLWAATPLDLLARYGAMSTPLLVVTGDADPFDDHARALAASWGRRRGTRAAVLSGPWGHDLAIGTRDQRLRTALAAAGTPGRRIADWLADRRRPAPGAECRLDVRAGRWHEVPPAMNGAA